MCGIFAYINYNICKDRSEILEILFHGLHSLKHRGCDSCGLSIDSSVHHSYKSISRVPLVFRHEGTVDRLTEHVNKEVDSMKLPLEETFTVHAGIAHTRWATHGTISAQNSHPQSSGEMNEFLVVHNGIITNYASLNKMLIQHGFSFESETDTEVVPKFAKMIFDALLDNDADKAEKQPITFDQVILEVVYRIKGACALIFKSPHFPNELIAYNRGSSLLLGVKELNENTTSETSCENDSDIMMNGNPKELFFSSDKSAIVEHTSKVLVIGHNELVHVKDGKVFVFKYDVDKSDGSGCLPKGDIVKRSLLTLDMEVEKISMNGCESYMQKEIYEQPESLKTTMRGRLIQGECKAETISFGGLKDHLQRIRNSRRLILVGCGTSYNAALAARPILEELSDIPVSIEVASDLVDRKGPIFAEDTSIFLSQSGETQDTRAALDYALQNGALCIGITNTVCTKIAMNVHCGVYLNAGPELAVPSTKAYTSQIVVMIMLALVIGDGRLSSQSRREAIINGLFDLPSKVQEVLKLENEINCLARLLIDEHSLLICGRGYNYATALEGALKVKEVALMHTEGIVGGELKHGPLALVDETLPVVVIATDGDSFSMQQSLIQLLLSRKSRVIVICSKGSASFACPSGAFHIIEVPRVEDCLQSVINIVPLQLLSYHLAALRGLNMDNPRNLAKSVTTH